MTDRRDADDYRTNVNRLKKAYNKRSISNYIDDATEKFNEAVTKIRSAKFDGDKATSVCELVDTLKEKYQSIVNDLSISDPDRLGSLYGEVITDGSHPDTVEVRLASGYIKKTGKTILMIAPMSDKMNRIFEIYSSAVQKGMVKHSDNSRPRYNPTSGKLRVELMIHGP